jgi:outer membrane lipopolysaccharide assembly protein LptE/RlpB
VKKQRAVGTAKIYSWVPGARIGRDLDVASVGTELENLIAENHQQLPAEKVVERAQDPLNPLHNAFTWDDGEAAHLQRISEANHLLRSVRVTIVDSKQREVTMRMTVTREHPNQPNKFNYTTTEYALSKADLRAEVLGQALRELIAIRRKYAELSELSQVFSVIDRIRTRRKAA